MKKKIIRLIMILCLTAALFCSMTVFAFADSEDTVSGYWIPYTVQSGDTLYNICAAKSIDYNTQGSLICSFSGISDARSLRAGATIWLPASDKGSNDTYYTVYSHTVVSGDTWYNLCLGYKTTYNACSAKILVLNGSASLYPGAVVKLPVFTQPAASVSGSASSSATAAYSTSSAAKTASNQTGTAKEETKVVDTSYKYLVPITLVSGDTVGAICKNLDSDFSVYSAVISSINGISSFNSLRAGQKLYIPTNTAPKSGEYYKITEHTVVSGDSLKDICKSLNVDLNASLSLIKAINTGLTNPGMIYVGQKLLIPVSVNASDAAASSSSATTSSTAATTTRKSSSVSSIMIFATDDGEVVSTIDGSHRTVASEGTEVSLDITPNDGYKISKITVTTYTSKKTVEVTGTSFVMPSEAVEVSVTFVSA